MENEFDASIMDQPSKVHEVKKLMKWKSLIPPINLQHFQISIPLINFIILSNLMT
jgi:hypothetical protein